MWKPLWLALFCLLIPSPCSAKITRGRFFSVDSWLYLDRFCFLPEAIDKQLANDRPTSLKGRIQLNLTVRDGSRYKMLFYWGEFSTWLSIYNSKYSELTCKERERMANHRLKLYENSSSTQVLPNGDHLGSDVTVVKYFDSAIPKYFFIALSNCDDANDERDPNNTFLYTQGAVDASIRFEMTNGEDLNNMHFSADEVGLYAVFICFFVIQCILIVGSGVVSVALKSRRKLHITVKLFMLSLLFQWFSLLFAITYYSSFASTGEASSRLQVTSDVFASISESIFLLVLICLAKGWTIVRRKISVNGRLKIACFLTTYFMSCLTVVIWKHVSRNSATQIYYYESPAGIMYVCARCFALVWFWYSAKTTMKQFGKKKRFYKKFVLIFTCWMALTPFIIYLCSFAPDWSRMRVVYTCNLCAFAVGQILLLVLYNPLTTFNSSFPFHAMTTAMNTPSIAGSRNASNHLGSDTMVRRAGGGGKVVISNPFERQHVAKLRLIERFISDNVRALQEQQHDLRRVLCKLDDGDQSASYMGMERNTTSDLDANHHPRPAYTRLSNSNEQAYDGAGSKIEMTAASAQSFGDDSSPGPNGKESFDKWWDNVHNSKPSNTNSPSTLAPPTWRKPNERMSTPSDSRFGDAPAPSPDPLETQPMSRYHRQQQPNGYENSLGDRPREGDNIASMEVLKQKMLLMESEFDPSKQSDLPSIRTPNVKTVSVASAAANDSSRKLVEDFPSPTDFRGEAKSGFEGDGRGGGGNVDNGNEVQDNDMDREIDDEWDRKLDAKGTADDTPAKKKKKKKEKKAKKDKDKRKKSVELPPGMAAPLKAPEGVKEVGGLNSNSNDQASFLTDWGDSNGPRTDTPTRHLAEEKNENEGKWDERDLSFLGDSGE